MSTLIRSEAVSFYAARVRAELAGVDPEVLEDLTDGLEADLTEALLDAVPAGEEPVAYLTDLAVDVLDDRFGTPAEYAAELAQAAEVEIPVRGENDGGRRRRGAAGRGRADRRPERELGRAESRGIPRQLARRGLGGLLDERSGALGDPR